jgi:hypothetical protein
MPFHLFLVCFVILYKSKGLKAASATGTREFKLHWQAFKALTLSAAEPPTRRPMIASADTKLRPQTEVVIF